MKNKIKGSQSPKKKAMKGEEEKTESMLEIVESIRKEHIELPVEKSIPGEYLELEDKSIQLFTTNREERNNESDLDFDMDHEAIQPLELESNKDDFIHWNN